MTRHFKVQGYEVCKNVGKVVPGHLLVVQVRQAKDQKIADELHGIADDGDEHDHLVDHRAPVRFHVGEVHAVIVVPELVGVEEKLRETVLYSTIAIFEMCCLNHTWYSNMWRIENDAVITPLAQQKTVDKLSSPILRRRGFPWMYITLK